jgi:hypothetical protein
MFSVRKLRLTVFVKDSVKVLIVDTANVRVAL